MRARSVPVLAAGLVLAAALLPGATHGAAPAMTEDPPVFELAWGSYGGGDGQFYRATGVAVGDDGRVYVGDHWGRRVQVFDEQGTFLQKWSSQFGGEIGDIELVGDDTLWTVEHNRHHVLHYTTTGTFLGYLGSFGGGPGQLAYPTGLTLDAGGNVYVVDRNNVRVQKFDPAGNFLAAWGVPGSGPEWGEPGSGPGQFNGPVTVDVGPDGAIYVAEHFGSRVQKFVAPNAAPDCSEAVASTTVLWPPNHEMVPVEVLGVTDPDGDPVTVTIDAVHQDEPVDGRGDGATAPDASGVGSSTALLRAERAGGGNGRVYHVGFTADDGNGGTCTGEVTVTVPANRGKKGAAVDDGPLFDATTP